MKNFKGILSIISRMAYNDYYVETYNYRSNEARDTMIVLHVIHVY